MGYKLLMGKNRVYKKTNQGEDGKGATTMIKPNIIQKTKIERRLRMVT